MEVQKGILKISDGGLKMLGEAEKSLYGAPLDCKTAPTLSGEGTFDKCGIKAEAPRADIIHSIVVGYNLSSSRKSGASP